VSDDLDFERLWGEHAQPLLRFLIYRTNDRPLSEDILGATFERAIASRRRFDRRRASEKTWLYSIALNLVRDHARHEAVVARTVEHGLLTPAAQSGAEIIDQAESRAAIRQSLEVLAPDEREAIALRYGADLTMPQIAKLTGVPLTTVEGRIYRALQKLRRQLE